MSDEKININTADQDALVELPGIAEALAIRIVQYRENIHPFESIEDLAAVPGISDRMVRELSDLITTDASESDEPAEEAPSTLMSTISLDSDGDAIGISAEIEEEPAAPVETDASQQEEEDSEPILEVEVEAEEVEATAENLEVVVTELVDETEPDVEIDLSPGTDLEEAKVVIEEAIESHNPADGDLEVEIELEEQAAEVDGESGAEAVIEEIDESEVEETLSVVNAEEKEAEELEAGSDAIVAQPVESDVEETPVVEPVGPAEPEPVPVPASGAVAAEPAQDRIDWRASVIGALLGIAATLLMLGLMNGGLVFQLRANTRDIQSTLSNQTDAITQQNIEIESQAGLIEQQIDDLNNLAGQYGELVVTVDSMESTNTEQMLEVANGIAALRLSLEDLQTAIATSETDIADLQEVDAALQEVDDLLSDRIDVIDISAEELDLFLLTMRDLLISIKGLPDGVESSVDPLQDSTGVLPTRTPRATPTPLSVPTQNP